MSIFGPKRKEVPGMTGLLLICDCGLTGGMAVTEVLRLDASSLTWFPFTAMSSSLPSEADRSVGGKSLISDLPRVGEESFLSCFRVC